MSGEAATPATIPYEQLKFGQLIGSGGFADVFKGLYQNQPVAIKKWKYQQLPPHIAALFAREVAANRNVHSDFVVKFMGVVTDPVCIVTELVSGRNLFELINSSRIQYTWADVLRVTEHVARGLHDVHLAGIVHRDMKSSNVLVDGKWNAKVCDLGLSRLVMETKKLTGGRGTPQWMAPEVIEHSQYDVRADIYSLGIVMWEMCARDLPFSDVESDHDIIRNVLFSQARPPMPAHVPARFADLIRRCWAQKPEDRPSLIDIVREVTADGFLTPQELATTVPFDSGVAPAPK